MTKIVAILAALLALVAGVWWYGAHEEAKGHAAGAAEIQTEWDADKVAIAKLASDAALKAEKDREDALANNEGVISDLQIQLQSARGLNTQLSASLRNYQTRPAAGGGGVPKAGGGQTVVVTAADPSVGRLDDALGAALSECADNRANQQALINELKPQL